MPEPGQYSIDPSQLASTSVEVSNAPQKVINQALVIAPQDYQDRMSDRQQSFLARQQDSDLNNAMPQINQKINAVEEKINLYKEYYIVPFDHSPEYLEMKGEANNFNAWQETYGGINSLTRTLGYDTYRKEFDSTVNILYQYKNQLKTAYANGDQVAVSDISNKIDTYNKKLDTIIELKPGSPEFYQKYPAVTEALSFRNPTFVVQGSGSQGMIMGPNGPTYIDAAGGGSNYDDRTAEAIAQSKYAPGSSNTQDLLNAKNGISPSVATVSNVLARYSRNPYADYTPEEMAIVSANRQLSDNGSKLSSSGLLAIRQNMESAGIVNPAPIMQGLIALNAQKVAAQSALPTVSQNFTPVITPMKSSDELTDVNTYLGKKPFLSTSSSMEISRIKQLGIDKQNAGGDTIGGIEKFFRETPLISFLSGNKSDQEASQEKYQKFNDYLSLAAPALMVSGGGIKPPVGGLGGVTKYFDDILGTSKISVGGSSTGGGVIDTIINIGNGIKLPSIGGASPVSLSAVVPGTLFLTDPLTGIKGISSLQNSQKQTEVTATIPNYGVNKQGGADYSAVTIGPSGEKIPLSPPEGTYVPLPAGMKGGKPLEYGLFSKEFYTKETPAQLKAGSLDFTPWTQLEQYGGGQSTEKYASFKAIPEDIRSAYEFKYDNNSRTGYLFIDKSGAFQTIVDSGIWKSSGSEQSWDQLIKSGINPLATALNEKGERVYGTATDVNSFLSSHAKLIDVKDPEVLNRFYSNMQAKQTAVMKQEAARSLDFSENVLRHRYERDNSLPVGSLSLTQWKSIQGAQKSSSAPSPMTNVLDSVTGTIKSINTPISTGFNLLSSKYNLPSNTTGTLDNYPKIVAQDSESFGALSRIEGVISVDAEKQLPIDTKILSGLDKTSITPSEKLGLASWVNDYNTALSEQNDIISQLGKTKPDYNLLYSETVDLAKYSPTQALYLKSQIETSERINKAKDILNSLYTSDISDQTRTKKETELKSIVSPLTDTDFKNQIIAQANEYRTLANPSSKPASVTETIIKPTGEIPFIGVVPIISPLIANFEPNIIKTTKTFDPRIVSTENKSGGADFSRVFIDETGNKTTQMDFPSGSPVVVKNPLTGEITTSQGYEHVDLAHQIVVPTTIDYKSGKTPFTEYVQSIMPEPKSSSLLSDSVSKIKMNTGITNLDNFMNEPREFRLSRTFFGKEPSKSFLERSNEEKVLGFVFPPYAVYSDFKGSRPEDVEGASNFIGSIIPTSPRWVEETNRNIYEDPGFAIPMTAISIGIPLAGAGLRSVGVGTKVLAPASTGGKLYSTGSKVVSGGLLALLGNYAVEEVTGTSPVNMAITEGNYLYSGGTTESVPSLVGKNFKGWDTASTKGNKVELELITALGAYSVADYYGMKGTQYLATRKDPKLNGKDFALPSPEGFPKNERITTSDLIESFKQGRIATKNPSKLSLTKWSESGRKINPDEYATNPQVFQPSKTIIEEAKLETISPAKPGKEDELVSLGRVGLRKEGVTKSYNDMTMKEWFDNSIELFKYEPEIKGQSELYKFTPEKEIKIPGDKTDIFSGADYPHLNEGYIGEGSSEIPVLYAAPEGITYFTKPGKNIFGINNLLSSDILGIYRNPTMYVTAVKSGEYTKIPNEVLNSPTKGKHNDPTDPRNLAIKNWINEKDVEYGKPIIGQYGKIEFQYLLRAGGEVTTERIGYYKDNGIRIPIDRFTSTGLKSPKYVETPTPVKSSIRNGISDITTKISEKFGTSTEPKSILTRQPKIFVAGTTGLSERSKFAKNHPGVDLPMGDWYVVKPSPKSLLKSSKISSTPSITSGPVTSSLRSNVVFRYNPVSQKYTAQKYPSSNYNRSSVISSPGISSPKISSPGISSPKISSPGISSPKTSYGISSPGESSPGTSSGISSSGISSPGASSPGSSHGGGSYKSSTGTSTSFSSKAFSSKLIGGLPGGGGGGDNPYRPRGKRPHKLAAPIARAEQLLTGKGLPSFRFNIGGGSSSSKKIVPNLPSKIVYGVNAGSFKAKNRTIIVKPLPLATSKKRSKR